MPLPNFTLIKSTGETYHLNDYNDQVVLIVNTASECGLNSQFKELEDLYQTYKDQGLVILGFPSNQFKQESLSNEDMTSACEVNFGVTFPLNQRVHLNGKNADPLFQWLKEESNGFLTNDIKWNFTKFLIDRDGQVTKRFSPTTKPSNMKNDIEALL